VAGLSGVVGRHVRYANPRSLPEALNLALAINVSDKTRKIQGDILHEDGPVCRSVKSIIREEESREKWI